MPYDKEGNWTPDPEDMIFTDPDASKYLDDEGNDTRFGLSTSDGFIPDPPNIVELKKSGEWALTRPIHRRWLTAGSIYDAAGQTPAGPAKKAAHPKHKGKRRKPK
jgi:hypothetical protein